MSVAVMARIWPLQLDPTDKLVLLAIADNANDEGKHAYASEPTLITKTSLKERTLRYAIRHLQQHRWLTVEVRGSEYGTNLYAVHPDAGETCSNRTACLRGAPRAPQSEGHHVPVEGHHVPLGGAPDAAPEGHQVPRSIEEPSTEPSDEPVLPSAAAPALDLEIVDAEVIEPKPETAQTVLADYISWRRTQDINGLDKRTLGQLAKHLGEAFEGGHPADVVKRGLFGWHQSNTHPGALLSFIDAAARNGGRNGRVSDHEQRHLASVQELLAHGGAA